MASSSAVEDEHLTDSDLTDDEGKFWPVLPFHNLTSLKSQNAARNPVRKNSAPRPQNRPRWPLCSILTIKTS